MGDLYRGFISCIFVFFLVSCASCKNLAYARLSDTTCAHLIKNINTIPAATTHAIIISDVVMILALVGCEHSLLLIMISIAITDLIAALYVYLYSHSRPSSWRRNMHDVSSLFEVSRNIKLYRYYLKYVLGT